MADYFLSDVHLRLDHPDRGARLARVVDRLTLADTLTIVGDLCDFWYAARQRRGNPMACMGLRSLASFRDRGGRITALAGNHDAWLGRFYARTFGAEFEPGHLERDLGGRRTLIAHGHRFGARTNWKVALESRAFLAAFTALPGFVADRLGAQLGRTNERNQELFDRRGLEIYRQQVARLDARYDRVILGHVHRAHADGRMVILGGWQAGSAYLVVDGDDWRHVVEPA